MKYHSFLALLSVISVVACTKDEPSPDPGGDTENIILVSGSSSNYIISYEASEKANALELSTAFKAETGAPISTFDSSKSNQSREILVGKSSKSATQIVLGMIGSAGYGMAVVGEKFVIVGTDGNNLALALYDFQNNILSSPEYRKGVGFKIPRTFKKIVKDPVPLAFDFCIANGIPFTASASKVGTCPPQGNCYVAQGVATDGQYVYFVMRNNTDTEAVICKYTLDPYKFIKVGPTFDGGHCNDLTFNPDIHRVILAHGQSQGKILTFINPESLAVDKDVNITVGSGAITYCPASHKYAISQGGTSLHVADANLKVEFSKTRTDKTGYTAQGMGSDDKYIYFPMSGDKDNAFVTYDWNGKFVTTFYLAVTGESESMFSYDGKYYVGFYSGKTVGATLYKMAPSVKDYKYVPSK